MNALRTIAAAFSMFSAIPAPRIKWDGGSMRYMLCAFPLVGAFAGGALCLWALIAETLKFGALLYAAGVTLLPLAVTGGIHMDGFCDTADALASHAPPERKREILKDPHAGAFAVISLCAYMTAYFALASESPRGYAAAMLLGLSYIFERTLSGLGVLCFPTVGGAGLLRTFKESAAKKRAAVILLCEALVCAAAMAFFFRLRGGVMAAAGVLCLVYLRAMSEKKFGGMSGDLAGWFLQTAEIVMLAALVVVERVVLP